MLKRGMEDAMMDVLVEKAREFGIETIYGYYYPTAKNGMVQEFYRIMGLEFIEHNDGNTVWKVELLNRYIKRNKHIIVQKIFVS